MGNKNGTTNETHSEIDRTPGRISRMFDEIAPRYDLLNHLLSFGIDRSWRCATVREVMRRLQLPDAKIPAPILDVATGTADLILEFKRRLDASHAVFEPERKAVHDNVPAACQLVGVDFSPDMLELGRKKISARHDTESIRLMEADGLNLPFEANSFSAVTIAFGLRNMNDTERGIAELVRVCRPNGTVAILEFSMPDMPVFSTLYRFYFRHLLPRVGQLVSGRKNNAYRYLQESVVSFDAKVDVREQLQRAGLIDIVARRMTFGTVTLYCGTKVATGDIEE